MRILLATDSKPGSVGAVRMAALLSVDGDVEVEVVHVLTGVPVYGPGAMGTVSFGTGDDAEQRSHKARTNIERALSQVFPAASDWRVHIAMGPVPLRIVERAEEGDANLILLGSGRHGAVDRWFGTETALRVMQLSHVPVLAVPADAGVSRPKTVVVAADFSAFSQDAFAAALGLCAPGAVLHLVHVLAPPVIDATYPVAPQWQEDFPDRVRDHMEEWAQSIGDLSGKRLETHVLNGEAAHEVLELARRVGADLLVAGTHGASFFGRVLLGSVASALMRQSKCAVLVAPPAEPARELGRS